MRAMLLIVPTAGLAPTKNEPSMAGLRRISKAILKIGEKSTSPDVFVAFIGTDAQDYVAFFKHNHSGQVKNLAFSTNELTKAEPEIDRFFMSHGYLRNEVSTFGQIGVIGNRVQNWRIKRILKCLGYRNISPYESGELLNSSLSKELALNVITLIDPRCKLFPRPF